MSIEFKCERCGVKRTADEGAGQWFTIGVNEYGPENKRSNLLNIYAWPLGCRSQQDDSVHHVCSTVHLSDFVREWGQRLELSKCA